MLSLILATGVPMAASPQSLSSANPDSLQASILGSVHDSLGFPVVGASVLLAPSGLIFRTDSAGRFHARDIPGGHVTINVRRLGFSPLQSQVSVHFGTELVLDLRMQRLPQMLAEVEIRAGRECPRFAIEGILCRREVGNGFFMNRQEVLTKSEGIYFPALLLRDAPGFRQNLNGNPTTVESIVGWRCYSVIYDGGFPGSGRAIRRPQDVYAIEVYQPPDIPPEYSHWTWGKSRLKQKYSTPCTVVVMWSMREAQRGLRRFGIPKK
jgi:hypothetical protein